MRKYRGVLDRNEAITMRTRDYVGRFVRTRTASFAAAATSSNGRKQRDQIDRRPIQSTSVCASRCVGTANRNCVRTVSHTPRTLGYHRDLRGHAEADRCCAKSLLGNALVRFSVRQHARRESISKRARSTTPTSLRLKPTTCGQSDTAERKTLLQIPMFLDAIWIQRSTDVRERIVVGIV